MRKICLFLLLFMLGLPAWPHGGEEHKDMREEEAHAESAQLGPPRTSNRDFESGGNRYSVTFKQVPADPQMGQVVEIEATVKKRIDPPDPLLGAEMTVEGARVSVSQSGKSLEAHAEKTPGTYGVHLPAESSGQVRLDWVLQPDGQPEVRFDYSFEVARPIKQVIAWVITGLTLGGMTLYSLVRRRLVGSGWVISVLLSGAALGYAYYPQPKALAAVATKKEPSTAQAGLLIPTDLQRDLELSVEPVRWREVPNSIRVPGTVRIPEGSTHNLHARFPSRILTEAPRVGRLYERGEEMALLEEVLSTSDRASLRTQTIDLKARQLEFATRQVELRKQLVELESQRQVAASALLQRGLDLNRLEQLYAIQAVPLKELQAARSAYKQALFTLNGLKRQQGVLRQSPSIPDLPPPLGVQQYSLTAPMRGVISKVDAAQGEVVDPTKVLFTLVDLSRVWVEARVSERDLGSARAVRRARISTVAYPGPFYGRFVSIAPGLDPETRTGRVYFEVDNRDGKLLEGMSAQVEISGTPRRVLTVPSEALQTFDNQSRLFVKIDEEHFEARTVKVESSVGNLSIIQADLAAGTPVVVKGAGALASELARRASKAPAGGKTPSHD